MLWEEARAKGDLDATSNLGVLCEQQGDIPRARMLHEEARAKGHLGVTSNLEVLREQQDDIPRARMLYVYHGRVRDHWQNP